MYSYDLNIQGWTFIFQDILSQNRVNNSCKNAISEKNVEQFDS